MYGRAAHAVYPTLGQGKIDDDYNILIEKSQKIMTTSTIIMFIKLIITADVNNVIDSFCYKVFTKKSKR